MCWMYGININILKKIWLIIYWFWFIMFIGLSFDNDFIKIKFEFNNLDCIFLEYFIFEIYFKWVYLIRIGKLV